MSAPVSIVYERLVAYAESQGIQAIPEFGPNALHKKVTGNQKIVIAPGDESFSLGKIQQPKQIGVGINRRLATIDEVFRAYVAAYDPKCPTDERLQYAVTRELFDVIYAGLFSSYRELNFVSARWVYGSVAAPFGSAIMLVATVREFIEDSLEETIDAAPKTPLISEKLTAPSGEE